MHGKRFRMAVSMQGDNLNSSSWYSAISQAARGGEDNIVFTPSSLPEPCGYVGRPVSDIPTRHHDLSIMLP